jgi:large subunit ribosomal protein L7A
MPEKLSRERKVVGVKQSRKALQSGHASRAYLARDAQISLIEPLAVLCSEHNVPVVFVDTMAELGQACGIDVGASIAVVLSEEQSEGYGGQV